LTAATLDDLAAGLWLPSYRPGAVGEWTIATTMVASAPGYWGDRFALFDTALLSRRSPGDSATWMSIVPMEIESQRIGIAVAFGHTVVLGLGMGWCVGNVALRDEVDRVTVVEHDPAVIALIGGLGIFEQLPEQARAKITLVEDDALTWRPDSRVDSVQADIWAKLVEPQKWDDVHSIQGNIGAESLYFWGQELELWRLVCREAGHDPERLDRATLDRIVASTGLPLVVPDDADFPDKIVAAARCWAPRDRDWWR
jgi:hypothetical protein